MNSLAQFSLVQFKVAGADSGRADEQHPGPDLHREEARREGSLTDGGAALPPQADPRVHLQEQAPLLQVSKTQLMSPKSIMQIFCFLRIFVF